MAKTKEQTELIVSEPGNTAVAVPAALAPMNMAELSDDGAPQLSRLVLFNGTSQEEEAYGEHKKGMFLDALESRELGMSVKIAIVMANRTWVKFPQGARVPEYVYADKADVPPEDLEFVDGKAPAATECINAVVVVEGEAWPYLFVFKKTGLKAFRKCIAPIEQRRHMLGKSIGMYELSSVDDKNGAGQVYKRLTARAAGDPSPDMLAVIETIRGVASVVQERAQEMATEQYHEDVDDGIPI